VPSLQQIEAVLDFLHGLGMDELQVKTHSRSAPRESAVTGSTPARQTAQHVPACSISVGSGSALGQCSGTMLRSAAAAHHEQETSDKGVLGCLNSFLCNPKPHPQRCEQPTTLPGPALCPGCQNSEGFPGGAGLRC
jgi:hypothetical protein